MRTTWQRGSALILGVVLAAGLFTVSGHAASLAFPASPIGAGIAAIPRCANKGLSVVQTVATTSVTGVVVSGFPSACGGATVLVTVNNGSANSSGSGTVPIGGGIVTVTLASGVAVAASDQIDLAVTGP